MEEKITITKSKIQKDKVGHSKWLKHKESRFNTLFPKRLEKVNLTIRSLSKLSKASRNKLETITFMSCCLKCAKAFNSVCKAGST